MQSNPTTFHTPEEFWCSLEKAGDVGRVVVMQALGWVRCDGTRPEQALQDTVHGTYLGPHRWKKLEDGEGATTRQARDNSPCRPLGWSCHSGPNLQSLVHYVST